MTEEELEERINDQIDKERINAGILSLEIKQMNEIKNERKERQWKKQE